MATQTGLGLEIGLETENAVFWSLGLGLGLKLSAVFFFVCRWSFALGVINSKFID